MKALGGKTPKLTPFTRPGASDDINTVAAALDGSLATRGKDIKQACLLRDNNRCIATGFIDINVYHELWAGTNKRVRRANKDRYRGTKTINRLDCAESKTNDDRIPLS